MAWTYSGDPSSSDKDKVRFLIGDTDSSDPQLQDEEILWMLSENETIYVAASHCVYGLISKYSRLAQSKSVGDLSISYANRVENYKAVASRLAYLAEVHGSGAPAYCGGISISDKETDETDTDRVQPAFRVDLMKNKRVVDQTNDESY